MQLYDEMMSALQEWDKECFLDVIKAGLSRGLSAPDIGKEELCPLVK